MISWRSLTAVLLVMNLPALAQDASTAGCVDCELSKSGLVGKIDEQKVFNQLEYLTPEMVESMDSRKLGEMIVQRLSDRCDKNRDPKLKKP